jgi:hypothetical protein
VTNYSWDGSVISSLVMASFACRHYWAVSVDSPIITIAISVECCDPVHAAGPYRTCC